MLNEEDQIIQWFGITRRAYEELLKLRSTFGKTTNDEVLQSIILLAFEVAKAANGRNQISIGGDKPTVTIKLRDEITSTWHGY